MDPLVLATKYDKIAEWWHTQHFESRYGVKQLERALRYAEDGGKALDVGCGSGGRFIRLMQSQGFDVTGIDVSSEMVKLAAANHPQQSFIHQDICTWETTERFDFIVAWDSLFHLPLTQQKLVLSKLCRLLAKKGILIYTFGNAQGEHVDQWHDDTFYYSSIGINNNLKELMNNGLSILHLALDQFPEKHVYAIAAKQ